MEKQPQRISRPEVARISGHDRLITETDQYYKAV